MKCLCLGTNSKMTHVAADQHDKMAPVPPVKEQLMGHPRLSHSQSSELAAHSPCGFTIFLLGLSEVTGSLAATSWISQLMYPRMGVTRQVGGMMGLAVVSESIDSQTQDRVSALAFFFPGQ